MITQQERRIERIVLVEPRAPGYHIYSAFTVPRLGLPLMARILRGRGYAVDVFVQEREAVPMSALREADLVGVSATTSTAGEAYKIASFARGMGKPVVMGGPHVTFVPEEALCYCDIVVRGEGDETFPELVDALRDGADLNAIKGLSFYDNTGMVRTEDRPLVCDLDTLPPPDLNTIHFGKKMPIIPVQTSRGCPFHCTFCSVTEMFGHRFRTRSIENVLDELERYNGRRVFFVDDNFTAAPKRTFELLTRMKERGIRLKSWSAQTRVDIAKQPELMELMRETNCTRVYIGFESVNPKTLERFNKRQDVDDVRFAIETLHNHRVRVHGMFMLGADDDTPETIRETLRFANRMRIDTVQFLALTPLPGTKTAHELEMAGRIFTHDWRLYDGHHVVYKPMNMTPDQLQRGILWGMLQFYSWRQALKFAVRLDSLNAALRILGSGLVRKAARASGDFSAWLHSHQDQISDWARARGYEFDASQATERLVEYKRRIKDSALEKYETMRLKISTAYELKTRAAFVSLEGDIDRRRARLIKRRIKKLARSKSTVVLDFAQVQDITPEAGDYLARKLGRFKRSVRIKLIGAKDEFRDKLLGAAKNVPSFEFFDSVDSLQRNLLMPTRI
jgi:radical SAM superfamily enzyme YgiQ (UPF0313 family)/anti-anti-sigma regulatory factor